MSLSKEKPIEDKRDSFSFRFGDDLSADILQYLPLENKLTLEGVSKQFQKTVFERFYEMDIRVKSDWDLKNLDLFLKKREKLKSINKIKVIRCEYDLLLPIDEMLVKERLVSNRIIELILNNCHQLSQINWEFDWISRKNTVKFAKTCESKIVSVGLSLFYEPLKYDLVTEFLVIEMSSVERQLTANIESIEYGPHFFELKHKNLKNLSINFIHTEGVSKFARFVDNHKTEALKHLTVSLRSLDQNCERFVLSQISKLNQLIELKIRFNYRFNGTSFPEVFQQLADNCPKLKSISTNLWINSNEILVNSQLLSPLRQFKDLRRLELDIESAFVFSKAFMESIFEDFKPFEDLEYLTIIIRNASLHYQRNAISMTDIDINLPNLRYLEIKRAYVEDSETTPEILSRLSRLESIKIETKNKSIADQIRAKLIQNCKKIRTIEMFGNSVF